MKRFIIILAILIAAVVYFVNSKDILPADAGQSRNPNFVTKEELTSLVQTNIDIVWTEIDSIKNQLTDINSRLESIETKLDALSN